MSIKKGLTRFFSFFLIAVILAVGFLPAVAVSSAEVIKLEKTYDIAVAYDNSGSMYLGEDRWCKAKFAMEIFASMLDYNKGDKLTIFPMWEVVTDGSTPAMPQVYDGTLGSDCIEIRDKSDIDKISNMYTPYAGNTPFTPVTKAADYLRKSSASEKWLIVLTDGAFIPDENNPEYNDTNWNVLSPERTHDLLADIADEGINVQYFLIGETLQRSDGSFKMDMVKPDAERGLYCEQAKTTDELQEKLIGICNKIFQRNELVGKLDGNKLKLDVSMKSLIVFVQGQGAEIISLKNSDGEKINITMDSEQRKYSNINFGGPMEADEWGNIPYPVTDTSLYGQVVTFDSCTAGAYTLEFKGADKDKIKIFYEPDVDMDVSIYDKDGNEIDVTKGAVVAGDYIMKAKLVDAKTGADITKSELMGNNVTFKAEITYDGEAANVIPIDSDKGGVVTLKPGEGIDTNVTGKYLEDYTISSKDDPSIFPSEIVVIEPEEGLTVEAEVLQESSWYQLSEHKEWEPVRVDLKIDGVPLTDEQLDATVFDVKLEAGNKDKSKSLVYKIERLKGESAVNILLAVDEEGKYKAPETGKYDMTVSATTIANTGLSITSSDNVSFDIQLLPLYVVWLIGFLALLILVIIIIAILNQKVLPKDIVLVSTMYKHNRKEHKLRALTNFSKSRGKGKLTVSTPNSVDPDGKCSVIIKVVPVDKRLVKSKKRRVRIVEISSPNPSVSINNYEYQKDKRSGKIIDPNIIVPEGTEPKPIRKDCNIIQIEISSKTTSLVCNFKHK